MDISQGESAPLELNSLHLEKLVNLEELHFQGYFEDKKDIYALKDIIKLTLSKNISIDLRKNKSNFKVIVTLNQGTWTIETENNGLVTVNSKEELLKAIDTFELTLVD